MKMPILISNLLISFSTGILDEPPSIWKSSERAEGFYGLFLPFDIRGCTASRVPDRPGAAIYSKL